MDWKKVAGLLPETLAVVKDVVGGPVGAVAGLGGKLLAKALGVDATPDAVAAAIQADPAKAATLAMAQLEHDKDMQALAVQQAIAAGQQELDAEKARLADVADARTRDTVFISQQRENKRADIMLLLAFASVIAIVAMLILGDVDGATAVGGALLVLLGKFADNISTAFQFEFGSSRGSQNKDNALAAAANKVEK